MDILALINEEVKEIFSPLFSDASVSLETLEAEVLRASRELGQKVLYPINPICSARSLCLAMLT